MSAPYYTGDRVPLKFTVSNADITSSEVFILKPSNTMMEGVPAAVDDNTVSYNVPGSVTNEAGRYRAYFVNTLASGGERTHKPEFEVLKNPERWPR